MVKGVNRTVIEVNDTGSKIFEKIVFFVSPQYGNLNAKALEKAASEISLGIEGYRPQKSLRSRMKRRRRNFIASVGGAMLFILAAIILFVIL